MSKALLCIITLFVTAVTAQPPAIVPAGRSVTTDNDGLLTAPLNLWEANSVTQATGGSVYTHFFKVQEQYSYRGSQSAPAASTGTDAEIETFETTNSIRDIQLIPLWFRGSAEDPVTWTSSDEALAIVDTEGFVTHITDGEVTVTAAVGNFERDIPLEMISGATVETVRLVSGRLGQPHLREAITRPVDNALISDDGDNEHELFSTLDWSTHTYVRNSFAWAYAATGGIEPWTALAVWRTGKTSTAPGQSIRGTLISPDLIAFAWHNAPAIGTQYRYLDDEDTLHLRTVISRARIGNTDAGLARLDAPLPATVHPASLIPFDFPNRLADTGTQGLQLPAIAVNRNLRAMVADVGFYEDTFANALPSHIALRNPYYFTPVNGDSGSPVLWVIDGQLALVMTWYTPWAGHVFRPAAVLPLAEALGAQPPQIIDLSPYTNFASPPGPN